MALGRRTTERQQEFWVATQNLPNAPRHVFYETLNRLLAQADFDRRVEDLCEPYYAAGGRPSIPPGNFFRMLLIGYFENIARSGAPPGGATTAARCGSSWATRPTRRHPIIRR